MANIPPQKTTTATSVASIAPLANPMPVSMQAPAATPIVIHVHPDEFSSTTKI